jgi:hypothetical protein
MHEDGLGTSRLLLLNELDQAIPGGYWLAIPERSCGIVVPKNVSPMARQEAEEVIENCYRRGTTQMLPGLQEKSDFEILSP